MKLCPKCGKDSGRISTQVHSYCKSCWNEYQKDYYRRNPKRRKDQIAANKVRRHKKREHIIKKKSVPCVDCGRTYPWYVMDFDHVRGKKCRNLSLSSRLSLKKIDEEIAKCDVVCSNCHRIRTFGRVVQ